MRTLEAVEAGEELTVHYMMDMEDAPEWYQLCWGKHYHLDQWKISLLVILNDIDEIQTIFVNDSLTGSERTVATQHSSQQSREKLSLTCPLTAQSSNKNVHHERRAPVQSEDAELPHQCGRASAGEDQQRGPDWLSAVQMNVLQQAQLYVEQLRREASKTRINVSEAVTDMKVGPGRCDGDLTQSLGIYQPGADRGLSGHRIQLPQTKSIPREGLVLLGLSERLLWYWVLGVYL